MKPAKRKKAKKESEGAVLRRVTKQMDEPRFVESARQEEVANHHIREDAPKHQKP